MQTAVKYYSIQSAYLAVHQIEHEGKCAVVLDECMGSIYSPAAIRGIRVITFAPSHDTIEDLFRNESPVIEEKETSFVETSPQTPASLVIIACTFIWTLFGTIIAAFHLVDFFETLRHLPLGQQFSWKSITLLLTALRECGDIILRSGFNGFLGCIVIAPLLGVALFILKSRDTDPLSAPLIRVIVYVLIAVLVLTGA